MVALGEKISMNSTKIFIGVFMAFHLIVNGIIAIVVNTSEDNNKIAKKGSFIGHTIASVLVFALIIIVMKNPTPFGPQILKQNLFDKGFAFISVPLLAHLAVSIGFTVASFIEEDTTNLKNLSNIFNSLSTAVCSIIIVLCFVSAKTIMSMEEKAKKMKDKALAKTKAAAPTEGTPAETDTTATDAATTTDTTPTDTAPTEGAAAKDVEAFGKRQRRRNPPKRRRRRKKKY